MREWMKSIGRCSTVVGNVTSGGRDGYLASSLHWVNRHSIVSVVIMHFICNLTDRPVCILLSNEMVTVVVIVLINFWHGLLIISL